MNCTVVSFGGGGDIYSKMCTLFSLVGTKMYTIKFWIQCIWVLGIDPLTPQPPWAHCEISRDSGIRTRIEKWSGETIHLYFSISQPLVNGVFNSLPQNGSPTNSLWRILRNAAGCALGIHECGVPYSLDIHASVQDLKLSSKSRGKIKPSSR